MNERRRRRIRLSRGFGLGRIVLPSVYSSLHVSYVTFAFPFLRDLIEIYGDLSVTNCAILFG